MLNKVWIVSYFSADDHEATVTAFSNEEAARKCFESFKKDKEHVALDATFEYNEFDSWEETR